MRDTRNWVDVPGYVGMSVTAIGEVRGPRGHVLAQAINDTGHCYVTAPRRRKLYVHTAVLLAFVGPCPPGQEARHLNGVPGDNRVGNLCWGTRREQRADDKRNGVRRGQPQVLTDDLADEIRRLRGSGSSRAIGRRFGVSHTTVLYIWRRWIWQATPHADNVAEMHANWRGNIGSANGQAKLTENDVRRIRLRVAAGEAQGKLCVEFGISKGTMSHLVNRKTWSHVGEVAAENDRMSSQFGEGVVA